MDCAKRYLRSVASARRYLDDFKAEEARLMRRLDVNGVQYRSEPGSPNAYGDAIPDGIAELDELRAEHDAVRPELQSRLDAWNGLMLRMDYSHWNVLNRHYVKGETWQQIDHWAPRTTAQAWRNDALVELYELMPYTFRVEQQPAI